MAPTPSSKSVQGQTTPLRTPQSKHRSNLFPVKSTHPSPNPNSVAKENPPAEHPVEVIGRIRDYPYRKDKPVSALHISSDKKSVRVRTDIGYRDFSLDGVSTSEEEDLDGFYKKFVESRINGVKLGAKCTIMMYGPTGSGKSHTMFGCPKQPGIVYRALRDILGEGNEEKENSTYGQRLGFGTIVQVTVLEIYNEEIYDLLSNNNGGGLSFGFTKGNASKVRLEVMGKKAKNATFISGHEAGKITREVANVEKRRIVKSTNCNDRSSRSHCMIILDVPSVGGRLMLVDMAGSENIEQAGQIGFEAKMQTAKINQGNIALKRVVESIANGDSHVPFRDSKLTMLLQDSFEDDKSKILMILCASPDPKEIHKTISTLEYGAKAKCIVRGFNTPTKDKSGAEDSTSSVVLGSRIAAMDQFILKLQMENKLREKERHEAQKELLRKEEEIAALRAKLEVKGRDSGVSEEEINVKVNERTQILKLELEKRLQECHQKANEFVEFGRQRMEEKILQQQQEVEMLRRRLEEIETALSSSTDSSGDKNSLQDMDGNSLAKRLMEVYSDPDHGMEKSMDLDMGDRQPFVHDVKEIDGNVHQIDNLGNQTQFNVYCWSAKEEEEDDDMVVAPKFTEKVCLSTVFEEEEEGEDTENVDDEEVEKEIVEETTVNLSTIDGSSPRINFSKGFYAASPQELVPILPSCNKETNKFDYSRNRSEEKNVTPGVMGELENAKDAVSARRTRIQNIFMLCGNHRELGQNVRIATPYPKRPLASDIQSSPVTTADGESVKMKPPSNRISELQTVYVPEFGLSDQVLADVTAKNITGTPNPAPVAKPLTTLKFVDEQKSAEAVPLNRNRWFSSEMAQDSKENNRPEDRNTDDLVELYVKWEASKENSGKFIMKLNVEKDSSLADLRKLIETRLVEDNATKQGFTFLMLGDPTGAPVVKEKEATIQASKLPICNNQLSGHLACLRPVKATQQTNLLPFSSLENKLAHVLPNVLPV
ncbi:kinesin-like protein KIN-10A [Telopea speciosissima]|uniref:kinesin-like protein KIN-10A n=1 Tax=Telopea speciosissima TaxID=54955 RepID=UPI001CC4EB1A|nr:kinesin-like protein KIN-10A [Telopea speciosissima]XP_043707697.1 kinesin-like protein KIN-10A [Telopea speciosissima]